MTNEGSPAGPPTETLISDPRLTSQGAISDEALRKAEEFVEQEEGAANRLTGTAGTVVTVIAIAMTLFHLYSAYDIVPTVYSIRCPAAANTSSATLSTSARVISSSFLTPTSGIMISGTGALPVSFATSSAPSKIARACIS